MTFISAQIDLFIVKHEHRTRNMQWYFTMYSLANCYFLQSKQYGLK